MALIRRIRTVVGASALAVAVLAAGCTGAASTENVLSVDDSVTSGPGGDDGTSVVASTVSSTTTTNGDPTTETTPSSTSTSTTTTAPPPSTTTTQVVAAGLPSPDDVANQYDTLCLQSDNRELADKWFEPGVLDELRCRYSDDPNPSRGNVLNLGCDPIEDAAGDASHRCFFRFEGGGYSILVGDLGRGYRGLAATFIVD